MDLVAASDPFVGKTFQGRYRVLKKLGEGGMGAVYAGEHTLIKRQVALKVLLPQYAQNKDVVGRFLQEATVVTQLRHENIVDVTDMGQLEDGSLFMVQELLDGRDFADLIEREGAQPVGRTAHIVSQMCDALSAVHPNIVHRDLKPENVFLVQRRNDPFFVKILDFGISKIIAGEDSTTAARAKTKTGTAIGTVYYMSPEQARGDKNLDHRTDIYALGAVLYRALTNSYAFDSDSATMVLLRIMTEPPPSARALRPELPADFDAVVLRCMAKLPGDRFQTCAELRAALAPFVHMADAPIVIRGDAVGADAWSALTLDSAPVSLPVASAATVAPARSAIVLPTRRAPLYLALGVGALLVVGISVALALGAGSSGSSASGLTAGVRIAPLPNAPSGSSPTPPPVVAPPPALPVPLDVAPAVTAPQPASPVGVRVPGSRHRLGSNNDLASAPPSTGGLAPTNQPVVASPPAIEPHTPITPADVHTQPTVAQPVPLPIVPPPVAPTGLGVLGQGRTRRVP